MRSRSQKSPRETHETFTSVGASARPIASGDGHQLRLQRMRDDVARAELVAVAFLREDHHRFERARLAGGSMSDERINVLELKPNYGRNCTANAIR